MLQTIDTRGRVTLARRYATRPMDVQVQHDGSVLLRPARAPQPRVGTASTRPPRPLTLGSRFGARALPRWQRGRAPSAV